MELMNSGRRETQKVDIELLLKTVDVKKVLDNLGVKYKARRNDTELMIKCVNPNHQDKSGDSLQMNARNDDYNGVYKCNPCGIKGNFIKFLLLATKNSFKEIVEYLGNFGTLNYRLQIDDVTRDRESAIAISEEKTNEELPEIKIQYTRCKLQDSWDESNPAQCYLKKRNIDPYVAFSHEIGWADFFEFMPGRHVKDCIVFPIRYKGRLVSYFLRSYSGPFYHKVHKLFPPKSPVWKFPYNIDQCKDEKPIIVVEGIIDCLVVKSALLKSGLDFNVIAAYSNNPTKSHIQILRESGKQIICLPDRDSSAGVVLCDTILEGLIHTNQIEIALLPWGYDPGDCSYDTIRQSLISRTKLIDYITLNRINYGSNYLFG